MATPKRPRNADTVRADRVAAEVAGDQAGAPPIEPDESTPPPAQPASQVNPTPPERTTSPARVLSQAVDPAGGGAQPGADVPAALMPGAVLASSTPEIPPELDAALNTRERRTVWAMVRGLTYAQALDAAGVPPRAALRDSGPPANVLDAVDAVLRSIAYQAGISRQWIIEQTVALYRRAAQAEEILDRKGNPTGVYRFDGPTAAKCLDMLADFNPDLRPRRSGKGGISPGDVLDLMAEVARRGRQAPAPAPGRVLDVVPDRGDAAKAKT